MYIKGPATCHGWPSNEMTSIRIYRVEEEALKQFLRLPTPGKRATAFVISRWHSQRQVGARSVRRIKAATFGVSRNGPRLCATIRSDQSDWGNRGGIQRLREIRINLDGRLGPGRLPANLSGAATRARVSALRECLDTQSDPVNSADQELEQRTLGNALFHGRDEAQIHQP